MKAFGPYINATTIDFENGLAGSNFFLIHGATGAGKTTILDAMCYAIYGRCSGENRTGEMMRSENATPAMKTEVDFTFALGEKIYRVIRSPKYERENKRGTGTTTEKACVEIFVDNKRVYVEKNEDYFTKLLQFDADQFCQVVLLPQGEFRKFLMAGSGERSKILNVIFNAKLYEKVEIALKEKSANAKANVDNLNNHRKIILDETKSIANVTDDALNEDSIDELAKTLAAELENIDAEISKLEVQAKTSAAQLADGKALYADFESYDRSAKTLSAAKTALTVAEKDFNAAQIEYDARKAEESRRIKLESVINELNKIQVAISDLKTATAKLSAAEKSELADKTKLKALEKNKVAYETRLNELKAQIEKFDGADVKFNDAQTKLKQAQDYQSQLVELERLMKELTASKNRLAKAQKNCDEVQLKRDRMIALQRLGAAAKLAATLKDGEPCPVCGSTFHPHLAVSEEIIPGDEDIEQVEKILKRRQMEKDSAINAVAKITGNIDAINDVIKKVGDVLTVKDAIKICDDTKKFADKLQRARANLKKGEELTAKLYDELDEVRVATEKSFKIAENLRGIVSEKTAQISAEYLADEQKISADLQASQAEKFKLDDAFQTAEKNFRQALSHKSKVEGEFKTAEKVHNEAAEKVDGKVKPDLATLQSKANAAQNIYVDKSIAANKLRENTKRLETTAMKLQALATEISMAEENAAMWKKLSGTANGKLSFQRYYLSSMFRQVIIEANVRLNKMSSGRYQFRNKNVTDRRMNIGLDLEIFDANSATCRDVATLSGGESFLASLSLALGLAAVVKNTAGGIKLDTIFIDEGFGSLDSETLDYAINTLIDLQADGRLVGIISHVEELKQRVPNRLEITKQKYGSTVQFIS